MQQGERFQFARGVQVLHRPPNAIQFGLDARVVGVFETTTAQAHHLLTQFRTIRGAHTFQEIVVALAKGGLEELAAAALVEDLIHHGVLQQEVPLPTVAILGHHPLRQLLSPFLQNAGYRLRTSGEDENYTTFLNRLPLGDIVLPFQPPAQAPEFFTELAKHRTVLPVQIRDGRGYIGPVMLRGEGACLMCWELHLAEYDPHWHDLRRQHHLNSDAQPAVLLHTAAKVMSLLASLHSPMLAPGVPAQELHAGQLVVVLPTGETTHSLIPQQPACPICWGLRHTA